MMPALLHLSSRRAFVVGALIVLPCAASVGALAAQSGGATWAVKGRESLAWWQVEPNHGHLWATTCPGDPSWSAGESRTGGFAYRDEHIATSAQLNSRIPLFPRGKVTPVCREAVRGDITIGDSVHWKGVSGEIVIDAQQITTGADFRDAYMEKAVLRSAAFPEIKYAIDSLTEIRVDGDTIRATAMGTLTIIGRGHQKSGRVVAWRVPGGLRVRAQLQVPAKDMITVFGLSKFALNMGVVLGRWDTLYMGIDVILKSPSAST